MMHSQDRCRRVAVTQTGDYTVEVGDRGHGCRTGEIANVDFHNAPVAEVVLTVTRHDGCAAEAERLMTCEKLSDKIIAFLLILEKCHE